MLIKDTEEAFGEWLPDLPYFNNPGIVEARNCIPVDTAYKDFLAFSASGSTLNSAPLGAFAAIDTGGDPEIYVGTATQLYEKISTAFTLRSATTYNTASFWSFTQFDDVILAANGADTIQYRTLGSATTFGAASNAPIAACLGVINRFVIAGDTSDTTGAIQNRVRWSSIDEPTDWPDPGSSTANTRQAGAQTLDAGQGAVTGISNGQFYGLVFQQRGVTRFTYIGGAQVFQIDNFERTRGLWAPRSLIQVGNISFFLAVDGFYMTDGQEVIAIGDGKIDKWFLLDFDQTYRDKVTAGIDWSNKCIYWSYVSQSGAGTPDKVVIFNFEKNRWSYAQQSVQLIFPSYTESYTLEGLDALYSSIDSITISFDSSFWAGGNPTIMGFSGSRAGTFSGSALDAYFETAERDGNPFGRVFVRGVRPMVTGAPTSIAISLATRNTQDNASRTFGMEVQRNSRSGVCDFRTQGKFVSARCKIVGGFERALGLQFDVTEGDRV